MKNKTLKLNLLKKLFLPLLLLLVVPLSMVFLGGCRNRCDGCCEEQEPTGQFVLNDCGESYTIFWYYAEPAERWGHEYRVPPADVELPAYHNDLPVTIIGHDFSLRRPTPAIQTGGAFDVRVNSITIPYTVEIIDNRAFIHSINFRRIDYLYFEDNSRLLHIGDDVFAGNNLFGVVLPEGLLTIGCYAFSFTMRGESADHPNFLLTLPNSLQRIGSFAFASMRFSRVIIDKNLQYVGEGAFGSARIHFGMYLCDDNPYLFMYGTSLLRRSDMVLIVGRSNTPQIPHGTLRIGAWAFRGQNTRVNPPSIIPPSVQSIGDEAFSSSTYGFIIFCDTLKDMLIYRRFDMIGQDWSGSLWRRSDEPVMVVSIPKLDFGAYNSFITNRQYPQLFRFTAEYNMAISFEIELRHGHSGNLILNGQDAVKLVLYNQKHQRVYVDGDIYYLTQGNEYILFIYLVCRYTSLANAILSVIS